MTICVGWIVDKIFEKSQKHFLTNKADEHGAVSYHVEVLRYSENAKYYLESTLRLQDCSRPIFLEFGMETCNNYIEFASRMEKIDILINTLKDMREDLQGAYMLASTANRCIEENKDEQ